MVLVATQVKRRRGTTAENDAFTGAEGEITVDTEKHELRVHDGLTQGGFKVGSGTGALIIGQMLEVVGTADYTPVGCLLADGSEYTKAQFPDLWADFLTGTPKLQTCTYTEYANQIAEYGFCNKFAVDTTNETFKVPTRNKYRKLVKKIVNGTSWANLYDDGWCEQGGSVNMGSASANAGVNQTVTLLIAMANASYAITSARTDGGNNYAQSELNVSTKYATSFLANAWNNSGRTSVVGYVSWNVTGYAPIPDSTANITREFVVVANGTLNQEQMDWSAWASSLAGKANIDLSNTPSNIDYVIEIQEPTSANGYTWYRKYKSGWVEQGGLSNATTNSTTIFATITLPVQMSDINYFVGVTKRTTDTGTNYYYSSRVKKASLTTTGFDVLADSSDGFAWQVSGKSAQ